MYLLHKNIQLPLGGAANGFELRDRNSELQCWYALFFPSVDLRFVLVKSGAPEGWSLGCIPAEISHLLVCEYGHHAEASMKSGGRRAHLMLYKCICRAGLHHEGWWVGWGGGCGIDPS